MTPSPGGSRPGRPPHRPNVEGPPVPDQNADGPEIFQSTSTHGAETVANVRNLIMAPRARTVSKASKSKNVKSHSVTRTKTNGSRLRRRLPVRPAGSEPPFDREHLIRHMVDGLRLTNRISLASVICAGDDLEDLLGIARHKAKNAEDGLITKGSDYLTEAEAYAHRHSAHPTPN